MRRMNSGKKIIPVVAAVSLLVASLAMAQANDAMKPQSAPLKNLLSLSDVTEAGFVSPKIQPSAKDGDFPASATYFWVNPSEKQSPVNNLVMISAFTLPADVQTLFHYGVNQKDFPIEDGTGKLATLTGTRTAINFIKHGTYVVIIGPTATEVEALATAIASKIQ